MEVYVKEKPKCCSDCPMCLHFERDAHGRGKHEVACLFEGTLNNILYGNQLNAKNCQFFKSLSDFEAQVRAEERKRVCDELRELFQLNYDDKYGSIHITGIKGAIDYIEKGESK